jgi:hypothetical protein
MYSEREKEFFFVECRVCMSVCESGVSLFRSSSNNNHKSLLLLFRFRITLKHLVARQVTTLTHFGNYTRVFFCLCFFLVVI